jgi:ABC-type bacteriocin/lantibiotic exporter with double-glycine peptidase domain
MMIMLVTSTLGYMVLVFLRSIILQVFNLHATTNMHNEMAKKVMRSDITFFDSNPIGRITTRFAKDMSILDFTMIPTTLLVT